MEVELIWVLRLGVALAIGLLIGLERGWKGREAEEGERELGLRTLGLVGLAGGLAGLLGGEFGGLVIGLLAVALAVLLAGAYRLKVARRGDLGLTTEIATLATFLLASLAGMGHLAIASAGAVVTALLLGYKARLHRWVRALSRPELTAALKLLLISVVLLPLLPDRGFGPWQALNPYVIWWMVVLIAAISFGGYFAVRIAGARAGILVTGLFGGLASSTATTLNLARLGRGQPDYSRLLAAGILLACGTMFPRMVLVAGVIHPPLVQSLLWPAVVMSVVTYAPALWMVRGQQRLDGAGELLPRNPLELGHALAFGALLTAVMLLGKALTEWFGEAGTYAVAAASGVADVDPVTLSLARMSGEGLAVDTAVLGIVIAASVNSLVKAGMAWGVGGRDLGLRVAGALVPAVVAGILIAFVFG